jgi:hypothetical protein
LLKLMPSKRRIVFGSAVFFTGFAIWFVLSLRNSDSTLSLVATTVKAAMCWPVDSNAACVLKTMAKYEKKGRYDEAVSTGVAWADKYPDNLTGSWIYVDISALYLRRATMDSAHIEEYLKQAVFYRDKALQSDPDSVYSLQRSSAISESIGDLSPVQQCAQYGNSVKLLNRLNLLANENKDRLARQLRPDLAGRKKSDHFLEWIDAGTKRLGAKSSAYGCQTHISPG